MGQVRGHSVIYIDGGIICYERSGELFQDFLRKLNRDTFSVIHFSAGARIDTGGLAGLLYFAHNNPDSLLKVCGDKSAFFDIAEVNGVLDMAINFPNLRLCYSCPADRCPYRRA